MVTRGWHLELSLECVLFVILPAAGHPRRLPLGRCFLLGSRLFLGCGLARGLLGLLLAGVGGGGGPGQSEGEGGGESKGGCEGVLKNK